MQLRDGTQVEDPRLDRLVEFDEQSREYPIQEALAATTPRSYTWRTNSWLDQGREGACVGFAVAHELAARPAEVQGLTNDFARTRIYWEAQKIDPWAGGAYPGASPQYEGTSVLAGVKIAHGLGYFKEYRWCFGIDDVVMALGYNGPVLLGIPWYSGMYSPGADGFIQPTGSVVGGHAILAKAVNVKDRTITLHNSWGRDWGRDGAARITWDHLSTLLQQRGEGVTMIKRRSRV